MDLLSLKLFWSILKWLHTIEVDRFNVFGGFQKQRNVWGGTGGRPRWGTSNFGGVSGEVTTPERDIHAFASTLSLMGVGRPAKIETSTPCTRQFHWDRRKTSDSIQSRSWSIRKSFRSRISKTAWNEHVISECRHSGLMRWDDIIVGRRLYLLTWDEFSVQYTVRSFSCFTEVGMLLPEGNSLFWRINHANQKKGGTWVGVSGQSK
jgi:hypothetical protein